MCTSFLHPSTTPYNSPPPKQITWFFFTFESLVPNCGDPIGLRWCCGNDSCVAEPEPRLEAPTSEELRRRLRRKGTGRCTGACGPSEAQAATNLESVASWKLWKGKINNIYLRGKTIKYISFSRCLSDFEVFRFGFFWRFRPLVSLVRWTVPSFSCETLHAPDSRAEVHFPQPFPMESVRGFQSGWDLARRPLRIVPIHSQRQIMHEPNGYKARLPLRLKPGFSRNGGETCHNNINEPKKMSMFSGYSCKITGAHWV